VSGLPEARQAAVPGRLLAADPAGLPVAEVDALVVGPGVAGLSTALALPAGRSVRQAVAADPAGTLVTEVEPVPSLAEAAR
jgi:hypothetical protein